MILLALPSLATAGLQLDVKPHKDVIVLGEPLIVTSTVRNETAEPIKIVYQGSPTYKRSAMSATVLRLSRDAPPLSQDAITIIRWFNGAWSDGFRPAVKRIPATSTLAPLEHVTSEFVIVFNREEGFAFEKPGQYWISAKVVVLATPGEQPPYFDVVAEPVAITVREPEARDRAVWDWLRTHGEDYGRLIQIPCGAKLPDEFANECGELAATSDSVYAEYLPLFLSRWYGEGPGKNPLEAARFAEMATAKASSEIVKTLVGRNAERVAKQVQSQALRELSEAKKKARAERPVEPAVQKEVESVFQGFIAAAEAGDVERCLELTAEDFRGWDRAKQREELQEDIDKLEKLRDQGVSTDLSARVLSVVGIGKDVRITAVVSYPRASGPPQENTVRCRVRKVGDHWLIQDWSNLLQGR